MCLFGLTPAMTSRCASPLCNTRSANGAALVQGWQARIADYPRELAVALVEEHLGPDDAWWNIDVWVERGAHLPLIQTLHHMQIKMLQVLLALNWIYLPDPRFKWTDRLIEQMTIRPEDLSRRLKQIFTLEPAAAVHATDVLFAETQSLVEQAMPEIDISFVRRWYQHRRPVHTTL